MNFVDFNSGKIRLYGRNVVKDNGVVLVWSLSGFSVRGSFNGKVKAECELSDGDGESACMLLVSVDGTERELRVERGCKEIVLAENCNGKHEIVVKKCSEVTTCCIQFKKLLFEGELLDAPEEKHYKIEFIGDSISCGVGAYPDSREGLEFDKSLHCDAAYAFPHLVSKQLNADANVVALAGWGVTRGSIGEDHRIPDVYEFTNGYYDRTEKWNFADFAPDCVVIELGANDGGNTKYDGSFCNAVYEFLKTVREKYPCAKIVWVIIALNENLRGEITEAFERFNDALFKYIDLVYDDKGALSHPCFEAQKEYARKVAEAITQ